MINQWIINELGIAIDAQNTVEIVKRMEEVRLMESRKSLRLMDRVDGVAPAVAAVAAAAAAAAAATATGNSTGDAALTHASAPSPGAADKRNANGIDVPGAYSRYLLVYLNNSALALLNARPIRRLDRFCFSTDLISDDGSRSAPFNRVEWARQLPFPLPPPPLIAALWMLRLLSFAL